MNRAPAPIKVLGKPKAAALEMRIVSAGTMHFGTKRSSSTLCTVELTATGKGTALKLTDQSAYYGGGEQPSDRTTGWTEIAERLGAFLAA